MNSVLRGAGCSVVCREVRSRKGGSGSDERVIAQRRLDDGTVELLYSRFVTTMENQ